MKLAKWLKEHHVKRSVFAEQIGVAPSYVTLLCSDEPGWPGRDVASRIREITNGAVTADDFLPPKPARSRRAPAPATVG